MLKKVIGLIVLPMLLVGFLAGCTPTQEPDVSEEYPSKAVELVVPFGAGGGSDRWSRAISSVAMDHFGQAMHVSLRPGAGAAVGTKYVKDAAPDGYVLLLGTTTPIVTSFLEDTGYSYEDFTVCCTYNNIPSLLAVHADSPFETWEDFVEEAKKRPGEISVGGTTGQAMGLEFLINQVSAEVNSVPYNDTGEAVTDMLGKHIDAAVISPGGAESLVTGGMARVLVQSGSSRDIIGEVFKDVPCAADLGLEAYGILGYVAVPNGTSEDIVKYVSEAFGKLLTDPSLISMTNAIGEKVVYTPYPEAHELYIRASKNVQKLVEKRSGGE